MSKNPNFMYVPLRFNEDSSIINYTNAMSNYLEMGMLDYKIVRNVTVIFLPNPHTQGTGELVEAKPSHFKLEFSFKINGLTCNVETIQPRGFAARIFKEFDRPKPSPDVQHFIRSIMFEFYREYIKKTMNEWLN